MKEVSVKIYDGWKEFFEVADLSFMENCIDSLHIKGILMGDFINQYASEVFIKSHEMYTAMKYKDQEIWIRHIPDDIEKIFIIFKDCKPVSGVFYNLQDAKAYLNEVKKTTVFRS